MQWDAPLSKEDNDKWTEIKKELTSIENITIPRYIGGDTSSYELLAFCDASASAYACCIYLRVKIGSDYKTNLIFAKSRISPKKQKTNNLQVGTHGMCYRYSFNQIC